MRSVTSPPPSLSLSHSFENRAVCNVEKHCRAGQAADDNKAHVRCMLDT